MTERMVVSEVGEAALARRTKADTDNDLHGLLAISPVRHAGLELKIKLAQLCLDRSGGGTVRVRRTYTTQPVTFLPLAPGDS